MQNRAHALGNFLSGCRCALAMTTICVVLELSGALEGHRQPVSPHCCLSVSSFYFLVSSMSVRFLLTSFWFFDAGAGIEGSQAAYVSVENEI